MKVIKIAGVVFIAILLGLLLLLLFRTSGSSPSPARKTTVVRPAPSGNIQPPDVVTFSFAKPPSLPDSLPVYGIEEYTTAQLEQAIRDNLSGFTIPNPPATLYRNDIRTTTWSRNGAEITLTTAPGKPPTVVFRQSLATTRPESAQSSTATASRIVLGFFPPPSGVSLHHLTDSDGPFDGLLITDSLGVTSVKGVTFAYTIGDIPILSAAENITSSSVVVDNLGVVRFATLYPPPRSVTPGTSVSLISKEDILDNLKEGRASVLSGYNAQTIGKGGALTFSSFIIDATSVVYARDNGVLFPALLIHGKGVTASGGDQEATYFLWASGEQQAVPQQ